MSSAWPPCIPRRRRPPPRRDLATSCLDAAAVPETLKRGRSRPAGPCRWWSSALCDPAAGRWVPGGYAAVRDPRCRCNVGDGVASRAGNRHVGAGSRCSSIAGLLSEWHGAGDLTLMDLAADQTVEGRHDDGVSPQSASTSAQRESSGSGLPEPGSRRVSSLVLASWKPAAFDRWHHDGHGPWDSRFRHVVLTLVSQRTLNLCWADQERLRLIFPRHPVI